MSLHDHCTIGVAIGQFLPSSETNGRLRQRLLEPFKREGISYLGELRGLTFLQLWSMWEAHRYLLPVFLAYLRKKHIDLADVRTEDLLREDLFDLPRATREFFRTEGGIISSVMVQRLGWSTLQNTWQWKRTFMQELRAHLEARNLQINH